MPTDTRHVVAAFRLVEGVVTAWALAQASRRPACFRYQDLLQQRHCILRCFVALSALMPWCLALRARNHGALCVLAVESHVVRRGIMNVAVGTRPVETTEPVWHPLARQNRKFVAESGAVSNSDATSLRAGIRWKTYNWKCSSFRMALMVETDTLPLPQTQPISQRSAELCTFMEPAATTSLD